MREKTWDRLFKSNLKKFSDTLDEVRLDCILNLLALGAELDELEWMTPYSIVHKPSKLGYQIECQSGEDWTQFVAEPKILD